MGHHGPLHPVNAEELANFTEETGAEVLRGPLCYPIYSGGWPRWKVGERQRDEGEVGEGNIPQRCPGGAGKLADFAVIDRDPLTDMP